eukprot:955732_1
MPNEKDVQSAQKSTKFQPYFTSPAENTGTTEASKASKPVEKNTQSEKKEALFNFFASGQSHGARAYYKDKNGRVVTIRQIEKNNELTEESEKPEIIERINSHDKELRYNRGFSVQLARRLDIVEKAQNDRTHNNV